jgi:hypothetical protein
MVDASELRQELAEVDRHIAEGQAQIVHQLRIVRELEACGRDTAHAKKLLLAMEETLAAMKVRRQQIGRELACAPDEQCLE